MQEDKKRSTSATLIGRIRDMKDKGAWDEFYARYAPRVKGWALDRRLSEADAEDLTQTVLIRVVQLLRSAWTYDPAQNFSGLLRKLWRWAFSDWMEKEGRRPEIAIGGAGPGAGPSRARDPGPRHAPGGGPDRLAELTVENFVGWLEDYMREEELEEALARLQIERAEDALLLRARLAGETAAQIAARSGQSVAAVGMRVRRAIDRLRSVLRELGSDLAIEEGES